MKRTIHNSLALSLLLCLAIAGTALSGTPAAEWPEASSQTKPWSRWWWMGSAVDKPNLTQLLTEYSEAGIGGLEICPIYGAKGYEDKFIDFLTPEWIEMLDHTLNEANRLGIGIDLTTGTGWPFGGPMVTKETASAGIILKQLAYENNTLSESLPKENLEYLVAVSADGQRINLTDKVKDGKLDWDAPEGQWKILAAAMKIPVQKVKRAAPGGDGYVVNPYSLDSLDAYLEPFNESLGKLTSNPPRCHFHDSFEYYGATWTPDFFAQFKSRRGYDLRDQIEALFGIGQEDAICRVMSDYHETINDLHLEYIKEWTKWCHTQGSKSRNQAHGAPANLVDLYGASDIPETEIFRKVEEEQLSMLKLSSSAAHLNGSNLVSSETFTWLKEHFQTSLADLKSATDFMFLSGVNHIFFHGMPYSPKEAAWPGWQFYASVNFSPEGGLWKDLPAYNAYVSRCQSILQAGKADNNLLLYFPIYDYWHDKEKLHMTFTIHNQDEWLHPSVYARTAEELQKHGYSYDAVSDSYLAKAYSKNGKIIINDAEYEAIVIPYSRFMPEKTMEKLLALAKNGATVLFQEKIPNDVPGLKNFKERKAKRQSLLGRIMPKKDSRESKLDRLPKANVKIPYGKGKIMVANLAWMLDQASVTRENLADHGISFIRRRSDNGYDYFLVNQKSHFEGWVALGKPAKDAILMDPLYENQIGNAAIREMDGQTQVYLQLKPQESLILRTFANSQHPINKWSYTNAPGKPIELKGNWTVEFIDGGPTLPARENLSKLTSWTMFDDKETSQFHGTARYTISFEAPTGKADNWILDLGKVCESARVTVNGRKLGTIWSEPFQICIGSYLKEGTNTLQIDVTNLAANRIRDLDINKVNWKYFHNINVVNIDYKPFDASNWSVFDSGLIGPVTLTPLNNIDPKEISRALNKKPTLYIIGDSTVHNPQPGLMGWGDAIGNYFVTSQINVKNYARGGRSSRTFITEGLWQNVLDKLQPGDYVLIQFGHNDGGPIDTGRARASIKGTGDKTLDVTINGKPETVHTYGWYIKKYITDAQSKGAEPIVVSPVPRNRWRNSQIERASNDYGKWAKESANETKAFFIDLNSLVADIYAEKTEEELYKLYFPKDHTHTSISGAELNAKTLIKAIQQLENCPLSESTVSSSN